MSWLEIPFKVSFKHASAERSATASFWIKATGDEQGLVGCGEGCPRQYVTNENLDSASYFFHQHRDSITQDITDIDSLIEWVNHHRSEIDQHPAAWCAIELAIIDLFGRHLCCSQEKLLGLSELNGNYQYSAVLGDSQFEVFKKQASQYLQLGFTDFKIKLSGSIDQDKEKVDYLLSNSSSIKIRADANNLWLSANEAINYLTQLNHPFWAIEEPIQSRDFLGLSAIAQETNTKIILDESFTSIKALDNIKSNPSMWILNFRVSKLGGIIRSLEIIKQIQLSDYSMIIGAHVGETSVLTRAGLTLATATEKHSIAMEGGFGLHLLEYDISNPSLMFSKNGLLDVASHKLPSIGNGLNYIINRE